jgi:Zn finger protein HypA/HybF involved in hydrogenase expression
MFGAQDFIARARPKVECAQCGTLLNRPEWSEHISDREIRHLWACPACGYSFETHVRLAQPKAA